MTPETPPEIAGGWHFRPRLVPTLAAAVVLPILLSLGVWQLERGEFKRDLIVRMKARAAEPAIAYSPQSDTSDGTVSDEPLGGRAFVKVIASGRYDGQTQVLLDNRTRGGKAGYEVFTPLRLAGLEGTAEGDRDATILVRRGWVPLGARRDVLPDVAVDAELREVRGTLITPPTPGLKLGEGGYAALATGAAGAGPLVLQWLDIDALRTLLALPGLEPGVIALDSAALDGYARDAVARTFPVPPERHHGYAVQWFALSATVLALWLGLNLKRSGPARIT